MKKLEVITRPGKMETVKKALESSGYHGVTVSQVEGHGSQKGLSKVQKEGSYRMEMVPKVRLEVVIPDSDLEAIIAAVSKAARTGEPGDGKIFVSDITDVIRIRTGERGEGAI